MENLGFPGSSLSGEKTKNTSFPVIKPEASILGFNSSSVVPGHVVLSHDIIWPGRK